MTLAVVDDGFSWKRYPVYSGMNDALALSECCEGTMVI